MSLDKAQQKKVSAKAEKAGFDIEEVCKILQVKTIADYRGNLGSALTKIEEARTRPSTAVAVLPPEQMRGLYPSQGMYELGQAARSFAPWANDDNHPFTDLEIALTIRRGDTLGVDVFNPHETQIWKDKRGNVNFQLAYTLMAGWASHVLGGHTRPQYTDLTSEEKEVEGIPAGDKACRCTFIMLKDLPLITTMIDAGWEAKEARDDLSMIGMATVSAGDWGGKYFAPNARSKRWKLEKRAYTDALRRRFGTPSRGAIEQLRRATGTDRIEVEDWKVAADEGHTGDAAARAAGMAAELRETKEEIAAMTPDEVEGVLVEGREILHGSPEDADWDAHIAKPEPEPPAQSATASTEPAQDISYGILNAVTNAGLTKNEHSYKATLARFTDLDTGDLDAVKSRFQEYRIAREGGMDTDQAARIANAKCCILKDGRGLGGCGLEEWASMVDDLDRVETEAKAKDPRAVLLDRLEAVRAHCKVLIEAAQPAPLDGKALRDQWASLFREAERLGLEVEPIKGDATDEQVAARINTLAPLVAEAEAAKETEEEKSND